MYVKKLKRKCSVRGCKNTDTYAISLSREVGNTVIICKSCLGKALGAIDNIPPEPEVRTSPSEAPALFFNANARGIKPSEAVLTEPSEPEPETPETCEAPADPEPNDAAPNDVTDTEDDTDTALSMPESDFVCPFCGQVCKTEQGLQRHIDAKHKDEV